MQLREDLVLETEGSHLKPSAGGWTQRISQKCLIKIVAGGPLLKTYFHKLSIKCLWGNFQNETKTCFE